MRNKAIKEYIPNIISGIRMQQSNMIVLLLILISLESMFDFIEEIFELKFWVNLKLYPKFAKNIKTLKGEVYLLFIIWTKYIIWMPWSSSKPIILCTKTLTTNKANTAHEIPSKIPVKRAKYYCVWDKVSLALSEFIVKLILAFFWRNRGCPKLS